MRIVITGAAGFIGSVLSLRAAERGHQVIALDDLSRGLNAVRVLKQPHVAFLKHDCQAGFGEALSALNHQGAWSEPVEQVDAVVHLAAGTGSLDRPYEELVALNVEMTKRVFNDAVNFGARTFVFPTTSLALGVPDSPYVRSKEDAMQWLLHRRDRGASTFILPLRFFNVLGAYKGCSEKRRREVHIVPHLVECYQHSEAFVINGNDYDTPDGTPSRDFVNVLDVADFILINLEHLKSYGKFHPELRLQQDNCLWVGTGCLTTALDVVNIFQQWIGPVHVRSGPRRAFDCGALHCGPTTPIAVQAVLGRPMAPAWVGIRDEAQELLAEYTA